MGWIGLWIMQYKIEIWAEYAKCGETGNKGTVIIMWEQYELE